MEIFMRNIPYTVDEVQLTRHVASVLHTPLFDIYVTSPGRLMNFRVRVFRGNSGKRPVRSSHNGIGTLTLPSESAGWAFLRHVSSRLSVDNRIITLCKSKNPPRRDVVEEIQRFPYEDPQLVQEENEFLSQFEENVCLKEIQLGWRCRDGDFSIEWEWPWHLDNDFSPFDFLFPMNDEHDYKTSHKLQFFQTDREILLKMGYGLEIYVILIRYPRIHVIQTDSSQSSILFVLDEPPSFEKTTLTPSILREPKRQKLTHLNAEHEWVAPYVWDTLRVVCRSRPDFERFKHMAEISGIKMYESRLVVSRRMLFAIDVLRKKDKWLCGPDMPWAVGFQCEILHRDGLLDTVELLAFQPKIDAFLAKHGAERTVQLLHHFGLILRKVWTNEEDESIYSCFDRAKTDVLQGLAPLPTKSTDNRSFLCHHVTFTPTGMTLRGPFTDVSNRIMRRYLKHQECFVRVTFTDEGRLKFRFSRDVDGAGFIQKRVGKILRDGFTLCGRPFQFLAYSQSALKEYTVWFVTPFKDRRGNNVDAEAIRKSIGIEWPMDVRRNPARFAARLSQAFTATEPSIFVEADQIERIPDIERNGHCFSDGNGPMSTEMAKAIHRALQTGSSRASRIKSAPSVFQIRIQGAKGTLSVDPTLPGMTIGLRPSMIKFEAGERDEVEVEVARSFTRPVRLFLNRPLVMILEGLGVEVREFLKLQHIAVEETKEASKSMKGAARLLEMHGLGASFALSATLTNLHKLGVDWARPDGGGGGDDDDDADSASKIHDPFSERCMKYAVNHVLREMKYRARIPVPESWKLVGVVDVHNILGPNEIYACIKQTQSSAKEYLSGKVVISKSPTIHPGDVQIATAIGEPPVGSPLRKLKNCVVFSQRGDRPLPNKLSGSDLDGDEYDLITIKALRPRKLASPGEYDPAPRKKLDRDATIHDVAEFVVDFINNDMLGVIAINFLLIADWQSLGIFHPNCLKLAELHSWAVDFPKSGVPVPHNNIPQPETKKKPDWFAPETTYGRDAQYYESHSVLGKLYRDIELPKLSGGRGEESRAEKRRRKHADQLSLVDTLEQLTLDSFALDDIISTKLKRRLRRLVKLKKPSDDTNGSIIKLFEQFVADLEHICYAHTLSRNAASRLSEEEVLMGTIIAKFAQPRARSDAISDMRTETTTLVRTVHKELEGGEDATIYDWINRAWTAWQVSVMRQGKFGAKCFGWIALKALFDGIKECDDD